MVFSVYNTPTNQLIVQVENNKVFITPAFVEPLKIISAESCFPIHLKGEKERVFGNISKIDSNSHLYPKALKMYCEAQFLTHPESYYTPGSL